MRPCASQAASSEPTAIAIEKIARYAVTTSSVAPSTVFTSGGISDSTTAPTSQNQLVTRPPHHSRLSIHRSLQQRAGRARDVGIDAQVGRALAGARDQQARDPAQQREHHDQRAEHRRVVALLGGEAADDRAEQDRHEGRAFDQRVAGGQLLLLQVIGQDAVFDRAEQRGDHAEQEQRDEHDRDRVQPESDDAERRDRDLGQLDVARDDRLVEAVGHLAAETGEEEERPDEHRGGERDQRLAVRDARSENRIRNTSAFFRKLSLNAEKNWHQNSGAKRRDVIRELDIGDSSRGGKSSGS